MCRSDCVDVTRKVQIYRVHRYHLGISASCGSSFHSENRTQTRFSQCDNGLFSYSVKCFAQTYAHCRLTFSCRGRRHCSDKHQLGVRLSAVPCVKAYFCNIASPGKNMFRRYSGTVRYLTDRLRSY